MKAIKKLVCAMLFLAIVPSLRAELSETFEIFRDWTYVGSTNFTSKSVYGWLGMAHVEDLTNSIVTRAGFPIPESAANHHIKTLCALGSVVAENNVPSAKGPYAQVEYLQQVTVTVDTLTTDEMEDVQVALSTGKRTEEDENMVDVWLYCLPKNSSSVAWVKVGKAMLGTYMRVNFAFDYSNQMCRVSVDGIPRMTEHGYLLPDRENATEIGAWYRLGTQVHNINPDKVTTVQFIGLNTKWDDVKISEEKFADHAPFPKTPDARVNLNSSVHAGGDTPHWLNVSLDDLNRWGLDDDIDVSSVRLDKSGHTVSEKLELGYDPLDGKIFAPTNMAMKVSAGGNESVTLMFPKAKVEDDLRYRIRATGTHEDGASFNEILPAKHNALSDAMEATGDLPANSPRVIFFQLEAERIPANP